MRDNPVWFRVLGAVAVCLDGRELKIEAPRQQALLVQLLIHPNQTVTTSKLIDGIWGASPPQHPESALHIVVSRLRRALEAAAPRLVRDASGYRIELDAEELDLTRVQARLAVALRAMRDGETALAASVVDEALDCWAGEPFAGDVSAAFDEATSRELRELRLGLVELRYTAYLRSGRHAEVLDGISPWIRAEPWRERLRAQQMVALYRCGRQIDALATYDELRRLLRTDFGVDPCDEIKQLHRRILRQDPVLREFDGQDAHRLVPSDVPACSGDGSIDRDLLIERLRGFAIDPADVVIIDGGPGVEKAWLVVEVPRRAPDEDVDLTDGREALRRMSLADSLARISSWMPPNEMPASPGAVVG